MVAVLAGLGAQAVVDSSKLTVLEGRFWASASSTVTEGTVVVMAKLKVTGFGIFRHSLEQCLQLRASLFAGAQVSTFITEAIQHPTTSRQPCFL